jgi:hypothetical protein
MTQAEFLTLLETVAILDPVSAHTCAEAGLLEFLWSEGYTTVVEAYLQRCPGRTVTVEP